MTEAMISRLISGTPRISSMKPTHRPLISGRLRAPAQRQQDAVGEGEQQAVGGEDHRHRDAAPQAGLDVAEGRDRQAPVRQDADEAQHQADQADGGERAIGVDLAGIEPMPLRKRHADAADDQRDGQEQAERDVELAEHQQEGEERADAPDRQQPPRFHIRRSDVMISIASMAMTAKSGRHCWS